MIRLVEAWAPPDLAAPWDSVGLQVGDPSAPAQRVLVALDASEVVLAEAEAWGASLLLVHHPPLFRPLGALRWDQAPGRRLARAVRAGLAIYAAHTNLDAAPGGVNDVLAAHLGLVEVRPLETGGLPRVGRVPEPLPLATWAQLVRERLNAPFVRVLGDLQRPVARVAVCGGAGADFLAVVRAAGADVYVTADVRYHEGQQAQDLNLAVVDPGHFATEHPVVPAWVERLRRDAEAAGWSGLQVRAAEQESETWAVVAV